MIEVSDKFGCCGCWACASICPQRCISMIYDFEGCEYPQVDVAQCIDCGMCDRVCPVANPVPKSRESQTAYLVQHNNARVLAQSTSGGAFTAFAQATIARGGIVFGAGWLRDGGEKRAGGGPARLKVGHFGVDREDDLWRFRNSKYTQSAIGPAFREVRSELSSGREVLFIGTPCQCEGLINYLGGRRPNLRVADFVCRAIPARAAIARQLEWLDAKLDEQAQTVLFRDKARFGYRYSQMAAYAGEGEPELNGNLYSQGVETDPYMRAFFSDICDRPSCYECAFKHRYRSTDLTCWDCFDVYRLDKSFDDNRGVTRVLAHTEFGRKMIVEASELARIVQIDSDKAVEGVRELVKSVDMNPKRKAFMQDCAVMNGVELFAKWFPDTPRVRAERLARHIAERLGVYDQAKRLVKKVMGK